MKSDVPGEIRESGRRLANPRRRHGDLGHPGREDHEGPLTPKRGRGSEQSFKMLSCFVSDRLAQGVVVADEVGLGHIEPVSHGRVAEVEHVKVDDIYGSHAAEHFEGGDAVIEEVAQQLRPSRLLLTRRIPSRSATRLVVPARPLRRVGDRDERVSRRTLVPEATGEPTTGDRRNPVGE